MTIAAFNYRKIEKEKKRNKIWIVLLTYFITRESPDVDHVTMQREVIQADWERPWEEVEVE